MGHLTLVRSLSILMCSGGGGRNVLLSLKRLLNVRQSKSLLAPDKDPFSAAFRCCFGLGFLWDFPIWIQNERHKFVRFLLALLSPNSPKHVEDFELRQSLFRLIHRHRVRLYQGQVWEGGRRSERRKGEKDSLLVLTLRKGVVVQGLNWSDVLRLVAGRGSNAWNIFFLRQPDV